MDQLSALELAITVSIVEVLQGRGRPRRLEPLRAAPMLGATRGASGRPSRVLRRGPQGVKICHAENHAKLSDSQLPERGSAPFAGPLVRRLPVAVEYHARDPYRGVPGVRPARTAGIYSMSCGWT